MVKWAGGPPSGKWRVVVDDGSVGGMRHVRAESVVPTPVTSSAKIGSNVGRRSAAEEERVTPAFDDIEEPEVEIVVWTTELEEALKKVTENMMADEDEVSSKVLDWNRQKYKEMMSSFTVRDAT